MGFQLNKLKFRNLKVLGFIVIHKMCAYHVVPINESVVKMVKDDEIRITYRKRITAYAKDQGFVKVPRN